MNETQSRSRQLQQSLRPVRIAVLVALGLMATSEAALAARFEIPGNDPAFRSRLYTGATIGQSRLDPDTRATRFDAGSGGSGATQIRLGIDLHNMLSVELDSTVLGTSRLSLGGDSVPGDPNVKYSAATVSALIYGLNGVQLRSMRQGVSGYLRLGYGIVKRASNVVTLDDSSTLPIVGLGAEYGFSNGLGVRAEVTRFDSDAVFFGLGAIYRFGLSPRRIGGIIARAAEPALSSTDTRVAADGRTFAPRQGSDGDTDVTSAQAAARLVARPPELVNSRGSQALAARIAAPPLNLAADADSDGIDNADDRCAGTPINTTVAADGCGVLDAVLSEVTFKPGSHFLTARARADLDRVAKLMLSFPEVPVEVQAHTDNVGAADTNLVLSLRRAEAVVAYLVSQQVNELQMQARGLGETRPLTSNATAEGRRRNRRVELLTLPNLTVAAMQGDAQGPIREPAATPLVIAARAAAASRPGAGAYPLPLLDALRIEPLPGPVQVDGLTIDGVIRGVGFASGSADLSAPARTALAPLVERLEKFPSVRIAVMAHTDSSGPQLANQRLSEARAQSVVNHLVSQGIAESRLEPVGYGERLPRVQNVTAEDRAKNRRIEVRVVR